MKPILIQQEETPLIRKTKELCQTILDQPAYQDMKRTIQQFLADEKMSQQYQRLCDLQDTLHGKHENGEQITDLEVAQFEREETEFLSNPIAQGFIDAQRAMHKIESTVSAYVRKTFELGRLPTDDDFSSGGCGPSCGCH
ncbi:MAG TPA: YlbF family regulator [Kiritimatiellia bacterium]|nr:YlbF family regulator [Kiritimatiellia bacterium]